MKSELNELLLKQTELLTEQLQLLEEKNQLLRKTNQEISERNKLMTQKNQEYVSSLNLLVEKNKTLSEQNQKQALILKQLQSAEVQMKIIQSISVTLQSHLEEKSEAVLLSKIPKLVALELEKELKPLSEMVSEKIASVEQYQQKLIALTQEISTRL